MKPYPDGSIAVELDDDERGVLLCGLHEWGGPAHCTEALAVAMGFQSVVNLYDECRRLGGVLADDGPLTPVDWRRVLVATEIVFASDVYGAGVEWSIVTGYSDEETVKILRRLQRKLIHAYH